MNEYKIISNATDTILKRSDIPTVDVILADRADIAITKWLSKWHDELTIADKGFIHIRPIDIVKM